MIGIKSKLSNIIKLIIVQINSFLDRYKKNNINRFDDRYFISRTEGEWYSEVEQICRTLMIKYNISSAIDFGCGNGVYLKILSDIGVKDILGYECSKSALRNCLISNVHDSDLRNPIRQSGVFDLVLCIEVAPYLHEKYEDILIETLISATGRKSIICFSASDVYAGGIYHINLKSKKYWKNKFETRGWRYSAKDTENIVDSLDLKTMFWIMDNLAIFKRI